MATLNLQCFESKQYGYTVMSCYSMELQHPQYTVQYTVLKRSASIKLLYVAQVCFSMGLKPCTVFVDTKHQWTLMCYEERPGRSYMSYLYVYVLYILETCLAQDSE